ncbi:MAG TPA: DNA gyrase modulator, partial [Acidimicrobiales bacterium]|nr:DNA gyrase modulator [Acidimicrobiales bacterium]
MSQSNELLDLAVKVAGWAKPGEEVEAYVGRSNSTTVRVYDSDIESLSAAQEEGVGIRVIVDGRQGFAYAGSLEASVIEDTLAEARDNAGFAERDEFNALATPDGVTAPDMDLYRESLLSVPTEKKVELAFELERKLRAADQRIRTVPMAAYADGADEVAIATSTGIAVWGHDTSCVLQTYCLAADGEETQTGFGFTVGRQL